MLTRLSKIFATLQEIWPACRRFRRLAAKVRCPAQVFTAFQSFWSSCRIFGCLAGWEAALQRSDPPFWAFQRVFGQFVDSPPAPSLHVERGKHTFRWAGVSQKTNAF